MYCLLNVRYILILLSAFLILFLNIGEDKEETYCIYEGKPFLVLGLEEDGETVVGRLSAGTLAVPKNVNKQHLDCGDTTVERIVGNEESKESTADKTDGS